MNKLNMAPDQQGYQVQDSAEHIHNKLAGGAGRIRRDYTGMPVQVDVQWTCDAGEFDYLQAFYRVQEEGTVPFLMDLIIHSNAIEEHECRFMPGTFRLTAQNGGRYIVKAKLEAIPPIPDIDLDEGIVTTFEGFGLEGALAYADLARLVNVVMPASLR